MEHHEPLSIDTPFDILLKPGLVGAVEARNYVRNSFSQRALSMTWTWTQDLSVLSHSSHWSIPLSIPSSVHKFTSPYVIRQTSMATSNERLCDRTNGRKITRWRLVYWLQSSPNHLWVNDIYSGYCWTSQVIPSSDTEDGYDLRGNTR